MTPAVFEIYVAKDGTAEVYTDGYSESTKARYAAAFNAVDSRSHTPGGIDESSCDETQALSSSEVTAASNSAQCERTRYDAGLRKRCE